MLVNVTGTPGQTGLGVAVKLTLGVSRTFTVFEIEAVPLGPVAVPVMVQVPGASSTFEGLPENGEELAIVVVPEGPDMVHE